MRIERTGPIKKLTPRFVDFLVGALRGVSLDEIHSHQKTRIDYACLNWLVAIELKALETDPSERTHNFVDSLRSRDDFPTFFGSVPLEAAFKNMKEPEKLRRAAMDRLGRAIITHMKKANDQLGQHMIDYPRRTCLKVLVLINEDHPEYDPQSVAWIAQHEMARENDAGYRYANIDAVIYLTERHGQTIDGRVAMPIAAIHGPMIEEQAWKEDLLQHIARRWSTWQGRPFYAIDEGDETSFDTIEHVPDEMPRHELWRLQYRRQPYLRHLNDDELRNEFDEVMLVTTLWGIKGSPIKLNMESSTTAMERFTHIQIEMHERALPMERFGYEFHRELAAARRLKLPQAAIDWLHTLEADRGA